jgi:Tfp pilus assembly protein PilO
MAALTALAVGAFYLGAYRIQTARLARLNERIDHSRQELAECATQTDMLPSVAADVDRLKAKLKDFKALPAHMDLPGFMKDLASLSQESSLTNLDQRQGETVRGERLDQKPLTSKYSGDFVNVYTFLRHAEELPRLTRIPSIKIKRNPGDKPGQVKLEMTIDIYSLAE